METIWIIGVIKVIRECWGSIGIMEKKMEASILHSIYLDPKDCSQIAKPQFGWRKSLRHIIHLILTCSRKYSIQPSRKQSCRGLPAERAQVGENIPKLFYSLNSLNGYTADYIGEYYSGYEGG